MRKMFSLAGFILSMAVCFTAQPASADVIATDGAVVVTGNRSLSDRRMNEDNSSRALYRNNNLGRGNVVIQNNDSRSNGGTLLIENGRVNQLQNGDRDLGNGSRLNSHRGRVDGTVGNVRIRN